jgi:hypothetical protein
MSTGFECAIVEVAPHEWWYLLQNSDCPVGAWDWMEYATIHGPFASLERATTHLLDTQANPGGWSEHPYVEGQAPNPTIQALIEAKRLHLDYPRFAASASVLLDRTGQAYAFVEDIHSPRPGSWWPARAIAYGPFPATGTEDYTRLLAALLKPDRPGGFMIDDRGSLERSPQALELVKTARPLPPPALEALAEARRSRPRYPRRGFGLL